MFSGSRIADHMAVLSHGRSMFAMGFHRTVPPTITGLPLILSACMVRYCLVPSPLLLFYSNDTNTQRNILFGRRRFSAKWLEMVHWLLPRLSVALPLVILAHNFKFDRRPPSTAARGLNVIPYFIVLIGLGLSLVSASISAVGVMSFIGLLSPYSPSHWGS